MRPLIDEAVGHKDLGGNHKLFPLKYLLKTAAGIPLLEKNKVLTYLANESVATIYLY